MVEANEFWPFQEHSAQELPNLCCLNESLEHAQQDSLPACMNPGTCMLDENNQLPWLKAPAHSKLSLQEADGASGFGLLPPFYLQNLLPAPNLNIEGKSSVNPCGLGGKPDPEIVSGSFGKKYLIFDQCGDNTRWMYSSVCSPLYPSKAAVQNVYGCELGKELQIAKNYGYGLIKPNLHEEYYENHVTGGDGSDMHEDTEEINALLYSDSDEDPEEDDEVMSTGHSPIVPKRTFEKVEQFDNFADEVDSYSGPKKRQKVNHGEDKELFLAANGSALNCKDLDDYHSDAESNIQEENVNSSPDINELSKKTKIRETLRKLECIIPGAEGKDPLLIIDEAIDYLKSLKHRAITLGVHHH